jgi:hypothetical protein
VQADPVEIAIPGQASISCNAGIPGKQAEARDAPREPGLQPIPEMPQPCCFACHLGRGNGGCATDPDAERRRQGSRAQVALLTAAVDQRQKAHARPPPDVERADSLRSIDLMAGNRHEIDMHCLNIERNLAEGLSRVGMEEHPPGAA